MAAVQATGRVWQQISADTKDLCDLPPFWPQARALGLPAVQHTARDVRSGLLFLAFAQRRSAAASAINYSWSAAETASGSALFHIVAETWQESASL